MNIEEKENYQKVLTDVYKIVDAHEKAIKASGERFNIFEIIGRTSDECGTHSAFLAEMLRPSGLHGFGSLFLKLFINVLNIGMSSAFDFDSAIVEVEEHTGYLSDDSERGGRIDIIIYDNKNNGIVIENKIYANDQYKQLYRYDQYAKSKFKNYQILYLTLDGKSPDEASINGINGKLESGKHFIQISYKEHISKWLTECIQASETKSQVKISLKQYHHIIKDLTGNSNRKIMENEITELIKDSENFVAAFNINKNFKLVTEGLIKKLLTQIKKIADDKNWELKVDNCWALEKETYLTFKIPDSKYDTGIKFCFDRYLSDLCMGVHCDNYPDRKDPYYNTLRKEVLMRLAFLGKERGIDNWLYLHYYTGDENESKFGGLKTWNENYKIWINIDNGELANYLFGKVEEIMEKLKGVEL